MSTAVAPDEISQTELNSLAPTEASVSGTEEQRFLQAVSQWYREWIFANETLLATNAISPTQILVIRFSRSPDVERSSLTAIGEADEEIVRGGMDTTIAGMLLSTENMRDIIRIRESFGSLNEAVKVCCKELDPSDTFVIIPLAQRRVLFHLQDAPLNDWKHDPPAIPIRSNTVEISAKQIDKDVSEFYSEGLRLSKSPLSQMIWKGRKYPYQLLQSPERRIQSYLLLRLKYSYAHLQGTVNEEVVSTGGRCDIQVEWPTPMGAHYKATTMLELKVLIEGRPAHEHLAWAHSGIVQANDYRIANTEAVFACIFDARKDQSDQMPVLDAAAKDLNVELRRYPMEAPIEAAKPSLSGAVDAKAAAPRKPKAKAAKSAKAAKATRGKADKGAKAGVIGSDATAASAGPVGD